MSHSNKSNKDPHSTFDHSQTLENTLDFIEVQKLINLCISSIVYGNFNSKEVDEKSL